MNIDWHKRYTQQAGWSESTRRYFFEKPGLKNALRILEVGCGTGAILAQGNTYTQATLHGLDLSLASAQQAQNHTPAGHILVADGHSLPYAPGVFDLAYCHYLLLWAKNPLTILREMTRVTRPGGWVAAFAEPDYGGRIDHPPALATLGQAQAQSLREQGADTHIGRKLSGLFAQAGLTQLESGTLGGGWSVPPETSQQALEWQVARADLAAKIPPSTLKTWQQLDEAAWQTGERVLFVPTFYAWGRVAV